MTTLILHEKHPVVQGHEIAVALSGQFSESGNSQRIATVQALTSNAVAQIRQHYDFDINALPEGFDPAAVRLVVSDMLLVAGFAGWIQSITC